MEIIMFQVSWGTAKGTSSFQKRIHGEKCRLRVASTSSLGTERSD